MGPSFQQVQGLCTTSQGIPPIMGAWQQGLRGHQVLWQEQPEQVQCHFFHHHETIDRQHIMKARGFISVW
jgi:hypothetical protein